MKKYDVETIKFTAMVFGMFALFTSFYFAFDVSMSLSRIVFILTNILLFGCVVFISLYRIVKSVQRYFTDYEKRICNLENQLRDKDSPSQNIKKD
jgi:hypothetical protein